MKDYAIITLDNEIDRLLELPLIRSQRRKRDRAIKTLTKAIALLESENIGTYAQEKEKLKRQLRAFKRDFKKQIKSITGKK